MPEERPAGRLLVLGVLRASDGSWQPGQVWIEGERIAAVLTGRPAAPPPASVVVRDMGESFLLPGAVDGHVHSYSHEGEGLAAATASAAAGGVTTIVEMPFDALSAPSGGAVNSRDRLLRKLDAVAEEARVDVALLGTLAPGGGWRRAEELVATGAVGFKVSLFLTDPVRFPRIDDRELLNVMAAVGETGSTLCTHAENNEVISGLLAEQHPKRSTDPFEHSRTRPPVAETLGVLTALEVAADKGNALHVCHLSLPRSIDLVHWYAHQGVDVTLEVCPHYLTFTEGDLTSQRGRLKINPPLRTADDRDGLWDRLAAGGVNVISSDHAPWPTSMKDDPVMLNNHSGVPGVETLVPVTLGGALARGLDVFGRAVDALTLGPARRYGLDAVKGSLEPGKDADLMVFTPGDAPIDGATQHSNAGWSPYDGFRPGGQVVLTLSRGRVVYTLDDGVTGRPGDGRAVTRSAR